MCLSAKEPDWQNWKRKLIDAGLPEDYVNENIDSYEKLCNDDEFLLGGNKEDCWEAMELMFERALKSVERGH